MRNIKILLLFLPITTTLIAQPYKEIFQFSLKLDSSYLFIDNSKRNWYTLNFKTDTLFNIEENIFFYNNKIIHISSNQFDNGKKAGVMGSVKIEKYALRWHEKWELDYQQKTLHKRVNHGEEYYYGQNDKPFLVWWLKMPENSEVPLAVIETNISRAHNQNFTDTTAIELNVTHQLFLDFVIHGHTSVSISLPVLENETLIGEINKLKIIANTLNVYGGYIDLDILAHKLKSKEKTVLRDSLNFLEIEVPDWMNIIKSSLKNTFFASFPEKENITNAASIFWEYKTGSKNFQDFIKRIQSMDNDENVTKISDDNDDVHRYFFTKNNSWFHCQEVFIEGEKIFCVVNFTATASTYNFNLMRFNELIDGIKLK